MDISLGCSGWVYGFSAIAQFLSNGGGMKRGLLLAGDTILKACSEFDKSTYPLFGDAGTATALEFDINAKSTFFHLQTDGEGHEAIIIPDGGFRNITTEKSLVYEDGDGDNQRNRLQLRLNGMDVFAFGISQAPQSVNRILEYASVERENVDYYLFHQANLFMNEKIRKKLKLTEEQVPYSLKDFGNTSSATIPLTMTTQIRKQLQQNPTKLIACGFGVGLSWGSVYFETNHLVCPELIEI
jgi:3-oxoacyl-[acyl-carrier-protein] synthase-3